VVLKTPPSLGLYCQFQVVIQPTKSNVRSKYETVCALLSHIISSIFIFFYQINMIYGKHKFNNPNLCLSCGTVMLYDSTTRLITLPEGSNA